MPGYVTFNLIDWTSVFTRHVSYPVLKSITGLGEEVKFDTGDACTRMLYMHNAATLHTVTNDAGEEMQTAACSFIAAPLVTWPKAPSLPASWSICCACRTCHFTFPGDVGARTKATFSSRLCASVSSFIELLFIFTYFTAEDGPMLIPRDVQNFTDACVLNGMLVALNNGLYGVSG